MNVMYVLHVQRNVMYVLHVQRWTCIQIRGFAVDDEIQNGAYGVTVTEHVCVRCGYM